MDSKIPNEIEELYSNIISMLITIERDRLMVGKSTPDKAVLKKISVINKHFTNFLENNRLDKWAKRDLLATEALPKLALIYTNFQKDKNEKTYREELYTFIKTYRTIEIDRSLKLDEMIKKIESDHLSALENCFYVSIDQINLQGANRGIKLAEEKIISYFDTSIERNIDNYADKSFKAYVSGYTDDDMRIGIKKGIVSLLTRLDYYDANTLKKVEEVLTPQGFITKCTNHKNIKT